MKRTIIVTPTPDLNQSQNFYHALGFAQLGENPYLYSDGKVIIEINPPPPPGQVSKCSINREK
jgi:predicted lactoylglutathione lyase